MNASKMENGRIVLAVERIPGAQGGAAKRYEEFQGDYGSSRGKKKDSVPEAWADFGKVISECRRMREPRQKAELCAMRFGLDVRTDRCMIV